MDATQREKEKRRRKIKRLAIETTLVKFILILVLASLFGV